jgi:hypothetical protein
LALTGTDALAAVENDRTATVLQQILGNHTSGPEAERAGVVESALPARMAKC